MCNKIRRNTIVAIPNPSINDPGTKTLRVTIVPIIVC